MNYLLAYFGLGLIFVLLNIDYRARIGWAGAPAFFVTWLLWPILLFSRIVVTFKRLFGDRRDQRM